MCLWLPTQRKSWHRLPFISLENVRLRMEKEKQKETKKKWKETKRDEKRRKETKRDEKSKQQPKSHVCPILASRPTWMRSQHQPLFAKPHTVCLRKELLSRLGRINAYITRFLFFSETLMYSTNTNVSYAWLNYLTHLAQQRPHLRVSRSLRYSSPSGHWWQGSRQIRQHTVAMINWCQQKNLLALYSSFKSPLL